MAGWGWGRFRNEEMIEWVEGIQFQSRVRAQAASDLSMIDKNSSITLFQSRVRAQAASDYMYIDVAIRASLVSIPRSGSARFRPGANGLLHVLRSVLIPGLGFRPFNPTPAYFSCFPLWWFQPILNSPA